MANGDRSVHDTWGKRLLAVLLWSLMALIFGLVGWYFGLKPFAVTVGNWYQARDYQAVDAKVVSRSGKASDGETATWLAASYEIGGKAYYAERLTILDDDDPDAAANAAVDKMLQASRGEDKSIKVWVSPRKPEIAVVSRDLPLGSLLALTPLAIGFSLFGLAGLVGAVGALFGFGYYRHMFDAAGLWVFASLWCGFIFPVLMLVLSQPGIEWVAVVFVGVFALIGILLLWGAIAASIKGTNPGAIQIGGSPRSRLPASALATTGGKHGKKVAGAAKRGGMGGRGDNFDKS